jgi:[protein-PII] uridylyltransferase
MMRDMLPLDSTAAFRASMPDRYLKAFDPIAVAQHGAIVARRAAAAVHVEMWRQRKQPDEVRVLCVVADDRPGLLSFICAALVIQGMDILSAQAYTRSVVLARAGEIASEAVDFLWVRRDAAGAAPIGDADIDAITTLLLQLIEGRVSIDSAVDRARSSRTAPHGGSTRVTFDEDEDEGLAVLAVETYDRPGLLLAITRALFRANVQIIASDAITRGRTVVDRFTILELDGSPIRGSRRGIVQIEVLGAIDALSRPPLA